MWVQWPKMAIVNILPPKLVQPGFETPTGVSRDRWLDRRTKEMIMVMTYLSEDAFGVILKRIAHTSGFLNC